jgi:hypothetical protein
MKEPEGLLGKLMSMTMPNEEVREFMEWLYILTTDSGDNDKTSQEKKK